mmetsp:Transcript_7042/g.30010  ORF Transcript_7042/g.30010 Transcript_7042/m.30010 type:complete len:258 (-) Transcript_7042:1279-2052(-)
MRPPRRRRRRFSLLNARFLQEGFLQERFLGALLGVRVDVPARRRGAADARDAAHDVVRGIGFVPVVVVASFSPAADVPARAPGGVRAERNGAGVASRRGRDLIPDIAARQPRFAEPPERAETPGGRDRRVRLSRRPTRHDAALLLFQSLRILLLLLQRFRKVAVGGFGSFGRRRVYPGSANLPRISRDVLLDVDDRLERRAVERRVFFASPEELRDALAGNARGPLRPALGPTAGGGLVRASRLGFDSEQKREVRAR